MNWAILWMTVGVFLGVLLGSWASLGIKVWVKNESDVWTASLVLTFLWPVFVVLFLLLYLDAKFHWNLGLGKIEHPSKEDKEEEQ